MKKSATERDLKTIATNTTYIAVFLFLILIMKFFGF